jgi:septal ring factor EnvC (AmiA/AmiB activator)
MIDRPGLQPDIAGDAGARKSRTAGSRRLAVVPTPSRERPVANLGKVFGQFAELQQQIAEQVIALEDSVTEQRQDLALAIAQLPEIRERINWLIANFCERSKQDDSFREKVERHDATLAALVDAVKTIHQAQSQWQAAMEELLSGLMRARTPAVPPLPQL